MNLSQLRYVITVTECGSFSKAAQKLYITQPTLSQQIAALENELGVRLFSRGKQVALTDAGAALMRHARAILEEQDRLLQHHRYVVAVPQGHPFWGKHYLTIQDLDGQPVIIPDKTSAIYQPLLDAFREHGASPIIVCECVPFHSSMQLAKSGLGLNLVTFPTARPLEVIDSCAVVPLTSFPADALSLVYMTHADSLSIQAIETFSAFVRGWSATFLEK